MSDSGLTDVFLWGNGLHVSSVDRLRTLGDDMLLQESKGPSTPNTPGQPPLAVLL